MHSPFRCFSQSFSFAILMCSRLFFIGLFTSLFLKAYRAASWIFSSFVKSCPFLGSNMAVGGSLLCGNRCFFKFLKEPEFKLPSVQLKFPICCFILAIYSCAYLSANSVSTFFNSVLLFSSVLFSPDVFSSVLCPPQNPLNPKGRQGPETPETLRAGGPPETP